MFGDRYFLERCLRWGFSVFVALFFVYSFIESPFARVLPDNVGRRNLPATCRFELAPEMDVRGGIGIAPIDLFMERVNSMRAAQAAAREACRRSGRNFVYIHKECTPDSGRAESAGRVVFCP